MPVWGKPLEESGDDQSEPLRMPIGDPDFEFTVLAIGDRRGERTMHRRTPVALRDEKDEQVLSIPDPEFGAQWYTIRLTRRKP